MQEADGNPETNKLGGGVTESALKAAIGKSGYPMQAAVVAAFKKATDARWPDEGHTVSVTVQEEWTYVDHDSDQIRAIDALAELHMWRVHSERQPRIRPMLSLLIECKQSELPHVFFTRTDQFRPQFPTTTGFPHDQVALRTDNDPSTFSYDVLTLWGLRRHELLTTPPVAVSLSKVRRKGGDLEVSGEDTFNALTLPLLKATEHLRRLGKDVGYYGDGRVVVPLAVIRGPMVAVVGDGQSNLEAVPWVRVQRYEPEADPKFWQSHRLLAYDVVHEDFLPTYLDMVMDYADQFAKVVAENQLVLLDGRGFAEGLGSKVAYPVEVIPLRAEAQAVARRARTEHLRGSVKDAWTSVSERIRSATSRRG